MVRFVCATIITFLAKLFKYLEKHNFETPSKFSSTEFQTLMPLIFDIVRAAETSRCRDLREIFSLMCSRRKKQILTTVVYNKRLLRASKLYKVIKEITCKVATFIFKTILEKTLFAKQR